MQAQTPVHETEKSEYMRICAKCVMDTSDPEIVFDKDGVSNYWRDNKRKLERELISGKRGIAMTEEIVNRIKCETKDADYDCIIGLSGGVDSSFLAYWVKKLGLRPLAIHMDNGWNSELAVYNIERVVRELDIDLYTEVLDWEEFRDLQRSFFFASVPNCEIPTDHAIVATLFRFAQKLRIKYIISGSNIVTEGIAQRGAGHDNKDWTHISDIQKKFGKRKLLSYPHMSTVSFAKAILVDRVQFVPLLNYLDYDWHKARETLQGQIGWRPYKRKHGESLFTRFFQEYYLPNKFGIDKRRMHFSSLICAGQMTREEALTLLEQPLYSEDELNAEIEFVCDKLQFTTDEFSGIMAAAPRKHSSYRMSLLFQSHDSEVYRWARRIATGRKS